MFFNQKNNDLILALGVLAVCAMLLVPLPTVIVDILLTLNLSCSLLLLLVSVYLPNALSLLVFPSLILLVTLFRLSLNVATTRLILSNGDAGELIFAFGEFLIGGQILVGVIIFSIISIVNFIVIAKGSTRVSEVAARFALDSLPGRQSTIDSELKAGIITPKEASYKRGQLQRESQLYGSMDGAMKFIQGDAIAGAIIIAINIFGGIYTGYINGLAIAEAFDTYVLLTIGDGLLSQIPSILISVCAGIVVTRISSERESTLGSDIVEQVFAKPTAVILTGIIIFAIGLLPGIPWFFFQAIGLGFVCSGLYIQIKRSNRPGVIQSHVVKSYNMQSFNDSSLDMFNFNALESRPVGLIHSGLDLENNENSIIITISETDSKNFLTNAIDNFADWWRDFTLDYFTEVGLALPLVRVVFSNNMVSGKYSVSRLGVTIKNGTFLPGGYFSEINPEHAKALGFSVLSTQVNPLTGCSACWIAKTTRSYDMYRLMNLRLYNPLQFIALQIGIFFLRNTSELLTLSDVHQMLKSIEKSNPGLVSDMYERSSFDTPMLARILQLASASGINVRDVKHIIEVVATYCSLNRITPEDEVDISDLISFIRIQRKRYIIAPLLSNRGSLKIISLSQNISEIFEDLEVINDLTNFTLPLEEETLRSLTTSFESLVAPIRNAGWTSVTVLCAEEIREKVAAFINMLEGSHESVVSYSELDVTTNIEPLVVWRI